VVFVLFGPDLHRATPAIGAGLSSVRQVSARG
jgi:hypothetical protein